MTSRPWFQTVSAVFVRSILYRPRRAVAGWLLALLLFVTLRALAGKDTSAEKMLVLADITTKATTFSTEIGPTGQFTWWLPAGADEYVLPLCAGVGLDTKRPELMNWLRQSSPHPLTELPVVGLRYGQQMLVIILPWPHYAELIVTERVGIRFRFPQDRHQASPCAIVALTRNGDPLEVAKAFRDWRASTANPGVIPRPRPLERKIADLSKASRLLGAPHFYLWGPALFSRHDVRPGQWVAWAKAMQAAAPETFGGSVVQAFSDEQRRALKELAAAEYAMDYLTLAVAAGIESALQSRSLLQLSAALSPVEVIDRNRQALATEFGNYLAAPETWGDGISIPTLENLHSAGVEQALLLWSDLYAKTPRPDVVARAEALGYLVGPYDSYHSIHSPTAQPDDTWETAQFDAAAYQHGGVMNADGTLHRGFKNRGYHFSPQAAWPYVQQRVNALFRQSPYSAWFVDCDATAECFDDYSKAHPATMLADTKLRRQRLAWLEQEHGLVVGSEGGSVLFADVIHFGHGPQTPYIGHLDPAFRDPKSAFFMGRAWPPDSPESYFKPARVPPSLQSPYFDPTIRLPLYRAALGDEVIATHHWSYDDLKFSDVAASRKLLEILYMVPPVYHLNRASWPKRKQQILRHVTFWSPLHRELATAPLTRFEYVSPDRKVQRSAFQTAQGEVTITVNFGAEAQAGYPPLSATVAGAARTNVLKQYRANDF